MKKGLISFLVAVVVFINMSSIFVQADISSYTENVKLTSDQTIFEVEYVVSKDSAYAGFEFGVQCADGVDIKSVSYSEKGSTVGPKEARGLVWFGLFNSGNSYSDDITVTLEIEYSGEENTSIVLESLKIYTYDDQNKVNKDVSEPRHVVNIYRDGSDSSIDSLPEPTDSKDSDSSDNQSSATSNSSQGENNSSTSSTVDNNGGSSSSNSNSTSSKSASTTSTSSSAKDDNPSTGRAAGAIVAVGFVLTGAVLAVKKKK